MQNNSSAKKTSFFENILDFIEIAVFALVMVAVLFAFFIRIVEVDGDSMNNTLDSGDHLILQKIFYTPEHGDIVVIRRENTSPLIKRVIAVGGDTIEVNVETNQVFLNDEVLNEPYIDFKNNPGTNGKITVPEGHVFVMGDHRDNSSDSRIYGCFSNDLIIGKAIWRFLPFDSFGGVYDNLA